MHIFRYLILASLLFSLCSFAKDKPRKLHISDYSQSISNANAFNLTFIRWQQNYDVTFVTPKLRKYGHEYAKYKLNEITQKQKSKSISVSLLKRELSENKYTPFIPEDWDYGENEVLIIVLPMNKSEQRQLIGKDDVRYWSSDRLIPFDNNHQRLTRKEVHGNLLEITKVSVRDKGSSRSCVPIREMKLSPSSFRYISQAYKGNLAFYTNSGVDDYYDMNSYGYMAAYDPKCLIQNGLRVYINMDKGKETSKALKKKIQERIEQDFNL